MRLEEIESRLKAIGSEIDVEGADLDALEDEIKSLKEERAMIMEKAEKRKKLLGEVASGVTATEVLERGYKEVEKKFEPESAEYRAAWLKDLQGKELSIEERTAVSAEATIPTGTMNKIIYRLEAVPILKAVDMTYIASNITYPIEDTVADAAWVSMGSAATDSADTITSITLNAYKLIKTIEITADVEAMSIDAFESWLVDRLANKLERAVDKAILAGTGTNQAKGILTEFTAKSGTFTQAGMTYKDLMKVIAALPSEYSRNATFVMPRKLFFEDVLGMTTDGAAGGDKVVVIDAQAPAKYNILGYPVILDDYCTEDTLIFGDLKEYKFNFAKSPEVKRDDSVGFRTGSTVYRVLALADGKISTKKAFVVFDRAAS